MQKIVLGAILSLLIITGCTKNSAAPATTYPIQGLWVGTYTALNATYPFSFSIYQNGTMSYQSAVPTNPTIFATGTWNLSDTAFSFSVTSINAPSPQITQTGTATYSKSKGTLIGSGDDTQNVEPFTFTLNKVN